MVLFLFLIVKLTANALDFIVLQTGGC